MLLCEMEYQLEFGGAESTELLIHQPCNLLKSGLFRTSVATYTARDTNSSQRRCTVCLSRQRAEQPNSHCHGATIKVIKFESRKLQR